MTAIVTTASTFTGVAGLPTLPTVVRPRKRWATARPASTTPASDVVGTEFRALGTTVRLVVTDARALGPATEVLRGHLDALDRAASRFRADSEVSRLAVAAADGPARVHASPELAGAVRAALHAARITHGLVDPTVGGAVVASGYDADIDVVRARPAAENGVNPTASGAVADPHVPGWRTVTITPDGLLGVPRGCLLDLGASAKAYAADVVADRLARTLPGGFLVNLGGDIALSGDTPRDGWAVAVEAPPGAMPPVRQVLVLGAGQAVATSSTRLRAWTTADGERHHHIVDPRTGRTAPAYWGQVTCVGATALEANAASTAAVVLGPDAVTWLVGLGVPARLERLDGSAVHTPGWPGPNPEVEL